MKCYTIFERNEFDAGVECAILVLFGDSQAPEVKR
jgi:hypothetical protein